ncbi:MAG: phosphate ABC transporter permease subunit PstC [Ruminococcaceae bacterium]|nr:phosphate ABC transporter permease subunit PstC [Oscillospiraceae bacterium]
MTKIKEPLMKIVFLIAALVSIAAVILICVFLFANGLPAIGEIGLFNFLFGTTWRPANDLYGILPMIVGSICVTAGALVTGVPIGILTAVFMAKFCPKWLYKFMKPAINLLAGIPSVVYGFFGLVVLVPFVRDTFGGRGMSVLTASLLLGLMILPTIVSVSESAIRAVPNSYYEGGLALGASHERSVFKATLPAAKSGVFAGVVLGVGRALGETMAVMMVAGNQAVIPDSLTDGVRTLTTNIVMEMGYSEGLHREALIATAVVLFVFILIINLSFSLVKRRGKNG